MRQRHHDLSHGGIRTAGGPRNPTWLDLGSNNAAQGIFHETTKMQKLALRTDGFNMFQPTKQMI